MKQCPRCGRYHSGICGIPAGVTRGFGARLSGTSRELSEAGHGRPPAPKLSTATLGGMLAQARRHQAEVLEMLKAVPPELAEYTELLDREGKLARLITQVEGQIAARRGVKGV